MSDSPKQPGSEPKWGKVRAADLIKDDPRFQQDYTLNEQAAQSTDGVNSHTVGQTLSQVFREDRNTLAAQDEARRVLARMTRKQQMGLFSRDPERFTQLHQNMSKVPWHIRFAQSKDIDFVPPKEGTTMLGRWFKSSVGRQVGRAKLRDVNKAEAFAQGYSAEAVVQTMHKALYGKSLGERAQQIVRSVYDTTAYATNSTAEFGGEVKSYAKRKANRVLMALGAAPRVFARAMTQLSGHKAGDHVTIGEAAFAGMSAADMTRVQFALPAAEELVDGDMVQHSTAIAVAPDGRAVLPKKGMQPGGGTP